MKEMKKDRLLYIINRFTGKKVLIVGDIVADEYIYGKTNRISREAPVLILKYDYEDIRLGSSANTANNIRALGGIPIPVGGIGKDDIGEKLLYKFKEMNIRTDGIFVDEERPTVTKTRIMAGSSHTQRQQVIRIDREPSGWIRKETEERILGFLSENMNNVDGIIISDYGYKIITESILERIREYSQESGILVSVDSRFDLIRFQGFTIGTPNVAEVEEFTGISINSEDELVEVGKNLLSRLEFKGLLITKGHKGMSLFTEDGSVNHIPIYGTDEVADVTGAGDTVVSTLTIALASGATMIEAAKLSNYAGGIVVMKRGTATVSNEELVSAVSEDEDSEGIFESEN